MRKGDYLCKLHPDFHMPGEVVIGEGFDGDEYAARLKNNGVDAAVFFAKCHYGYSYYYTNIGTRHPRLTQDMLGEVVRGCRKHGLGVICYYSVFLDSAAAKLHPEWMPKISSTAVDGGFDSQNFLPVCVSSGYVDELLIPQSIEVAKNYDIDELFYDTMTGFRPCWCDNCTRTFGRPAPENSDDPDWMRYVRWYYNQYENFFAKVAKSVSKCRSGISVTFNWKWAVALPSVPPPHISRIAGDLIPSSFVASMNSRYWAGTGYPYEYMCGRFMHGLGEWCNSTPETLKLTAASSIANGGSFYLIDRQLPDGTLEERAWPTINDTFSFVNQYRKVVEDAYPIAETAVLTPIDHVVGPNLEFFPDFDKRKARVLPFNGAARFCITNGIHYTAYNAENLRKNIGRCRLVILPEIEYVDAEITASLRDFVENGGSLLISMPSGGGVVNDELLRLAGVRFNGAKPQDYGYIEDFTGGVSDPFVCRGSFSALIPDEGTETLTRYIQPLSFGDGKAKFGHGQAPPAGPDGSPAATIRKVGKGIVCCVAAPIFESYEYWHNPRIAAWVKRCVAELLPNPLAKLSTPALVEMVLLRRNDDLVINLVNHSSREYLAGYWHPVIDFVPEIHDIRVSVKAPAGKCAVIAEPQGETLTAEINNGYLTFTSPALKYLQSFVLPEYFSITNN